MHWNRSCLRSLAWELHGHLSVWLPVAWHRVTMVTLLCVCVRARGRVCVDAHDLPLSFPAILGVMPNCQLIFPTHLCLAANIDRPSLSITRPISFYIVARPSRGWIWTECGLWCWGGHWLLEYPVVMWNKASLILPVFSIKPLFLYSASNPQNNRPGQCVLPSQHNKTHHSSTVRIRPVSIAYNGTIRSCSARSCLADEASGLMQMH